MTQEDQKLPMEEIDMDKLSKETEIAMADYTIGKPLADKPMEFYPFVTLKKVGDKLAGTLLAVREGVGKGTLYDFELVAPAGKKVSLNGFTALNRIAKATTPDGKPMMELGKKYLVTFTGTYEAEKGTGKSCKVSEITN